MLAGVPDSCWRLCQLALTLLQTDASGQALPRPKQNKRIAELSEAVLLSVRTPPV
jgi:hypothetical protein